MRERYDIEGEIAKHKEAEETAHPAGGILHGYAFSPDGDIVHVNYVLNDGHTATITRGGEVLETTMCENEIQVVLGYYAELLQRGAM